jgi:hypothetical protein
VLERIFFFYSSLSKLNYFMDLSFKIIMIQYFMRYHFLVFVFVVVVLKLRIFKSKFLIPHHQKLYCSLIRHPKYAFLLCAIGSDFSSLLCHLCYMIGTSLLLEGSNFVKSSSKWLYTFLLGNSVGLHILQFNLRPSN